MGSVVVLSGSSAPPTLLLDEGDSAGSVVVVQATSDSAMHRQRTRARSFFIWGSSLQN